MKNPRPIELIRCPELTHQAGYVDVAVAQDVSRLVFTAGACPLDENGRVVAIGDFSGQIEKVLVNLATALHASGADFHDVVKTTVYVASSNREDLALAWEAVCRGFAGHDAPSTLVGVTVLGYQHQLVEIEAIAVIR